MYVFAVELVVGEVGEGGGGQEMEVCVGGGDGEAGKAGFDADCAVASEESE